MVDYQWRTNVLNEIYENQKKMADSIGVSTRTIRNWKSGNTTPKQGYKNKINRRWNYYKNKVGGYRELKIEATDTGTGESIDLGNRTNLSDLEALDEEIQDQEEFIQGFKDSLKAQGFDKVEIKDMSIEIVRFKQ